MSRLPASGLYAVLNTTGQGSEQPSAQALQAVRGGAVLVQYRNKSNDKSTDNKSRRAQAEAVLAAVGEVPLLINDDVELAASIGAAGVHLGRSDIGIAQARRQLGPRAIIGATCHDSLALARQAIAAGADYVSFGRFFTSTTKPQAPAANIAVLTQARAALGVPIVAIGGINADNGSQLLTAGADFLAVSAAVFAQPDCQAAAQQLSNLFKFQQ